MNKKTLLWIGLIVFLVIAAGAFYLFAPREGYTASINGANGVEIPGSIAVIETITLGGVEQYLTIRGVDTTNPVLLFLHGGPGTPSSPWATWNGYHAGLEENFVVVHWDQRGAGKSFSKDLTPDDMQMEDFVSDTLELANILRDRFDQEKIFLWGHSWGSGLGFETLRADSEPFYAFFASGVRPLWDESLFISYEKVLGLANEANDFETIEALEAIQPIDPKNPEHLEVIFGILDQYLINDFHEEGASDAWLNYIFMNGSSEYPANYIMQTMNGMGFSRQTIYLEILDQDFDLFRDFPVSTIPIHFFHGRYDYATPGELAEQYYKALEAPEKSFTWFEDSAHDIYYEEADKFNQELTRIANETLASLAE